LLENFDIKSLGIGVMVVLLSAGILLALEEFVFKRKKTLHKNKRSHFLMLFYTPRHYERLNYNVWGFFIICCAFGAKILYSGWLPIESALVGCAFLLYCGFYVLSWDNDCMIERRKLVESMMPESYWNAVDNDLIVYMEKEEWPN
jgi:hypothetical protein